MVINYETIKDATLLKFYNFIINDDSIVGYTTEKRKVYHIINDLYIIEGRYPNQYCLRFYKDIHSWVRFIKPIRRSTHMRYLRII
jgi:hypothetical protein